VRLADSLVCGSQSTGIVDFLRIVTETYLILHQYAVLQHIIYQTPDVCEAIMNGLK